MATKTAVKKKSPVKIILIILFAGGAIYLIYRYWYLIKGLFVSKSEPGEAVAAESIASRPSGYTPPSGNLPDSEIPTPDEKPGSYFPLKLGSRNSAVRELQKMANLTPNTGATITADGVWGDKTEIKVKAATAALLGKEYNKISSLTYEVLICKVWPNSAAARKIITSWTEKGMGPWFQGLLKK